MSKRNEPGAETSWQAMERTRKRKESAISTLMSKSIKKHKSQPNVLPPSTQLQVQAKRFWGDYPQKLLPSHRYPRDMDFTRVNANGTTSYKVILPGLWPVEFCQALLDFAEQEHDWDVAYGYMKAQYYLRSKDQGPNADKADVEGFMTEDIVEALAEWRREKEEEEERAAAAAALAEEEARASRRRKRRRLLP
ncbi:hypothetical protein B0A54_06438 [Friedmanniomyces endolithicus]|uniref:Uncharacterized protein n=1 Tax=Friedmanniomyces endolithicus TaxID=329885 RepID=A0A4U0UZ70_9PEZI|nr:hypothetical protein LTS09_011490 [Friedmanniomyces endolithicus]TKA41550.1 hypothetical protein B0A54_06438 [Friedmanniomyces endolithicus]